MGQLSALLRRCRSGDPDALEELVRRWERKLFYYVRRLVVCEADAWDVLQQTWVRVIQGIGSVRDPDKLAAWLYRVARNTALSHRQSLLAKERWLDHEISVVDVQDVELLEADWAPEEVHAGLDKLSPHHRDSLTLFFLQDLSIDQMAEVLGIPTGTVKSRLFYGKAALRMTLEKMRSEV